MNYKYRVEIAYSEQDEGYIARVPELGCSAWGETAEEVGHEVQGSIEAHLQALQKLGRPIPEPQVVASA
ncbi:MAG: type II toxin-antitoxin system HicB family antitoxin [Rubrobacter sp.]|nr:type II toxin-antitoxin system HicB family antitoxin [Rubrobacter sp.]